MGPPDLIGRVELDTDAVLALVQTIDSDGAKSNALHASSSAPPALTWLELTAGSDDNSMPSSPPPSSLQKSVARTGSPSSWPPMRSDKKREIRNPFDSLGDIALAVTAKLQLPASLGNYERALSTGGIGKGHCSSGDVVDAAVRVSLEDGYIYSDYCFYFNMVFYFYCLDYCIVTA